MPEGRPCGRAALARRPYCRRHLGPLTHGRPSSPLESLREWAVAVQSALDRRLRGEARTDEYDADLTKALLPVALPLYHWYWRVDVVGIENIPAAGPAVLAANHSGTVPMDGAMLKIAVLKEHGRNPQLLAADLAFRIPIIKDLIRPTGNARADRRETLALLERGELVGVFPEGFKGVGKGFSKRYQVQRFGRGGFVRMALATSAPIIPVAIVGAEETYPMIGNVAPIANALKLPYFPITPLFPWLGPLGAVPLPSKWILAFGEPIPTYGYGDDAVNDARLISQVTRRVRSAVQDMLDANLARRRTAFW